MKAAIKIGNSTSLVSVGSIIKALKPTLDKIIFLINDGKIVSSHDKLSHAKVVLENLGMVKGEKIRVAKFKAKSRYRKVKGSRAQLYKLRVSSIS